MIKTLVSVSLIFVFVAACNAQGPSRSTPRQPADPAIRSTPAYAELLLRKTELEAEAESLLMEFTEEYPKVKDIRLEQDILKAETQRLLVLKPADAGKLTLALGKLMLGKVSHAAALKRLQMQYQDGHPSVKKEKRMIEIFEAAIKEILG
jgi:hypothetical protein